MGVRKPDPASYLPLTPAMLHGLLALADGDRHGDAILKEVAARTDGQVTLGVGTLSALLKRLRADGLVKQNGERPGPRLDDQRRRYYTLTPSGRGVAVAEVNRLEPIIAQARGKRLLKPLAARG
jgi:DNA-binding PadR family transcriptional regulator